MERRGERKRRRKKEEERRESIFLNAFPSVSHSECFPDFWKRTFFPNQKIFFMEKKLWDGQPVKLNETTIFFYKNWSSFALISSIEVEIIYGANSGTWLLLDVVSPNHYQSWPNQITFRNMRIWCWWINKRKISLVIQFSFSVKPSLGKIGIKLQ